MASVVVAATLAAQDPERSVANAEISEWNNDDSNRVVAGMSCYSASILGQQSYLVDLRLAFCLP